MAKVFAAKCDIENVVQSETRNYGLQCLSKIMFSLESPYLDFDAKEATAPKVDESKLPQQPDPYREWLDVATLHQPGPSQRYMQQNAGRKRKKKYISGRVMLVYLYALTLSHCDPIIVIIECALSLHFGKRSGE